MKELNPSDGLFTVSCQSCSIIFPAENLKCPTCEGVAGDLHLDIEKMLEQIYNAAKQSVAIDIILDVFWNLHNKFDIMDDILKAIQVDKIDKAMMCSFCALTSKYSEQLSEYDTFYQKIIEHLKQQNESEESIDELFGRFSSTKTKQYWEDMKTLGAPEWLSGPIPNNAKTQIKV